MKAQRINPITSPAPSVFASAPFLGILTLDTRFPRLPGDIGNPGSFGVPALTRVVRGASPRHAVQPAFAQRETDLLPLFGRALRELEALGAAAITTSCGFLVLLQKNLEALATVPVVTSSLLLLPQLLEKHGRVGVLTISAADLGDEYLEAAGVAPSRMCDVVVEGVDPAGDFSQAIMGNQRTMDFAAARRSVVSAAMRLHHRDPTLTDVVLECTNMPPYARDIEGATGLRCWSLLQCERLRASVRDRSRLA